MNISSRLQKIIDTIDTCETLADIGCDHGYVAISAIKDGKAKRAVAADVAEGPLDIARKNCEIEQQSSKIKFILSDGFTNIKDAEDLNCAVIAGMGGLLMERILREGRLHRFPNLKQLVLSPQSDLDAVRKLLIEELSYVIRCEYMVLDEGKYYYIMDIGTAAAGMREHILTDASTAAALCENKLNEAGGAISIIPAATAKATEITDSSMTSATEATAKATEITDSSVTGVIEAADTALNQASEGRRQYSESEYMFGKNIALESRDIYLDYLKRRQDIVKSALASASAGVSDSAKAKAAELAAELKLIDEAMQRHVYV